MWSDNEAKADLLRFKYLSSSICSIACDDSILPTTIGLFGDWGSGKSTLLKMAKEELSSDKQALWIEFNGWLFENYADARTALMGTILDSVKERIKSDNTIYEKCKGTLARLGKRLDWFSVAFKTGKYVVPALAGLPHISAALAINDIIPVIREHLKDVPGALAKLNEDEIKSLLKKEEPDAQELRRSIQEFRDDFSQLLENSNIDRLVVSIDDLDRCLPDTVIDTLEAIRLFLFVPKTVFIIGADERLVEYAVAKRFPGLPSNSNLNVGKEYLEKMVQFAVRVPPLSPLDISSYMNLLMTERSLGKDQDYSAVLDHVTKFKDETFSKKYFSVEDAKGIFGDKIKANLEDDYKLVNQISAILAIGLNGSPRRIKRFLNTLLLRMKFATLKGVNLQRPELAKLMLLEYVRPIFFEELAGLQAKEEGKPKALQIAESGLSLKAGQKVEDGPASTWLADEWMRDWLRLDPALKSIDLRPYFYIAHDKIGSMVQVQSRMSPRAQDCLSRLLSEDDLTRKRAGKDAKNLQGADQGAILAELGDRIQKLEQFDESKEEQALTALLEANPGLAPQVVSIYRQIDGSQIAIHTPASLLNLVPDPNQQTVIRDLITEWSNESENPDLKKAAKNALAPKKGKV